MTPAATVAGGRVSPERFLLGNPTGTASGPPAGTFVGRDITMTDTNLFDVLDRHLARRSVGWEGTQGLARLAAAGVPTAGRTDPHDLARSCQAGGDPIRSGAVTAALVALAPGDETAGLCLLVALRPVLRRVAGRLVRLGLDREEAEQRVVAACWAMLAARGATTADDLVARTWSTLRTEIRRELRHRAVEQPVTRHDQEPPATDREPADRGSLLLADARRAGALTRRQAGLLRDTRLLDRSVDELAEATGRSRAALWKEGQRAAQALRRFLVDDLDIPTGTR